MFLIVCGKFGIPLQQKCNKVVNISDWELISVLIRTQGVNQLTEGSVLYSKNNTPEPETIHTL